MKVLWLTGLLLILAAVDKASTDDSDDPHYYTFIIHVFGTYEESMESEESPEFQALESRYTAWCESASLEVANKSGATLRAEDVKCDLKEIRKNTTDRIELEMEIHFAQSISPDTLPEPEDLMTFFLQSAVENKDLQIYTQYMSVPEHPTATSTKVFSKAYRVTASVHKDGAILSDPDDFEKLKKNVKEWCEAQCKDKFPTFLSCRVEDLNDIENIPLNASASVVVEFAQDTEKSLVEAALQSVNLLVSQIESTVSQLATSATTTPANAQTQRATASASSGVITHKSSLATAFCLIALSWLMTRQHCR